jgi:hypothetical protein
MTWLLYGRFVLLAALVAVAASLVWAAYRASDDLR